MARPPHVLINTFVETNIKPVFPRALKYVSILHALIGGNTLSVFTNYNTFIRVSLNSVSLIYFITLNYFNFWFEKREVTIVLLFIYNTTYILHIILTSLIQKTVSKYLSEIVNIEKKLSGKVSVALYMDVPLTVELSLAVIGAAWLALHTRHTWHTYFINVQFYILLKLNTAITSYLFIYLASKSANILDHLNKAIGKNLRSLKRNEFCREENTDNHICIVNGVAQKVFDKVKPCYVNLQNQILSLWQSKYIHVLFVANIGWYAYIDGLGIKYFVDQFNASNDNIWIFFCTLSSFIAGVAVPIHQICKSYQNIIHKERLLRTQLQSLASSVEIGIKQEKQLNEVIKLIDRNKFRVNILGMTNLDSSLAWTVITIYIQYTITLVMNVNQINIHSFGQIFTSTKSAVE